jgi:hypothetical protein
VVLQDESGNEIRPGIEVPSNILAHPDDRRFKCLRFVDPYGDTVFNRLQCKALSDDLCLLRESGLGGTHDALIRQIESLVAECQHEVHLYVRFIGD